MNSINVSDKIRLETGDEYCILEKSFQSEDVKENDIKASSNSRFNIKINSIRKPTSTATIFLTRDNEYVGHISANLYTNGIASLIMSGIHCIDLPKGLERYRDIIQKKDTALLVAEQYRRQGKASQLIKLMFQYLDKKGIRDLEVDGIVDDVAMQTYIHTGAEMIDEKKAIYRDIKRFLQENIHEMEKTGDER